MGSSRNHLPKFILFSFSLLFLGHSRVVQLLLNRGALLHRDHNGRNPLHLAAMNGYTQTMELLHSVHSHLLDQVDKDGVRSQNFINLPTE